jgi:hypothetical protein
MKLRRPPNIDGAFDQSNLLHVSCFHLSARRHDYSAQVLLFYDDLRSSYSQSMDGRRPAATLTARRSPC